MHREDVFQIPLRRRNGEIVAYALVDADMAHLARNRWCLSSHGYVRRNGGQGRWLALHRTVMGLAKGDRMDVDHINGDRLDNRRSNLRVVTRAQNHQNRHAIKGRYRGVGFDATRGKWRAQATLDYKNYFIGRFDTEEEAARAAADWRAEHMPYATN